MLRVRASTFFSRQTYLPLLALSSSSNLYIVNPPILDRFDTSLNTSTSTTLQPQLSIMPAKRVHGGAAPRPKGYFATAYDTVTAPDNQAVVRSLTVFGVCPPPPSHIVPFALFVLTRIQAAVGFLASPFADFLLPP